MGGEILEYEAKTIYRRGREDGMQKGNDAINTLLADLVRSGKISETDAETFGEKAKAELK